MAVPGRTLVPSRASSAPLLARNCAWMMPLAFSEGFDWELNAGAGLTTTRMGSSASTLLAMSTMTPSWSGLN
eukprot:1839342-Pyramimonas_sp.AAC.1